MVLETFTNTNGTVLTAHNAGWVQVRGYVGDGVINTNNLKSASGVNDWAYRWTGTGAPNTANQWASITITDTSGWIGVIVRADAATHNCYALVVQNGNQWLSNYTGGSWIGFVATYTDAVSVGDKWKVEANGSTLSVYKDTGGGWSLVGAPTDGNHTTGGIGVCGYSNLAGRGDDFDGGDLGTGNAMQRVIHHRHMQRAS